MPYEIDFIGVENQESEKNADAICFRWKEGNDYKIGVFDGGLLDYGTAMIRHLNQYYFNDARGIKERRKKAIDFVVVSHSDKDHTVGLQEVLKQFRVKKLYMNVPWHYTDELYEEVKDGRITPNSLENRLKDAYQYVAKLEEIAEQYQIPISPAFQGCVIERRFCILSPSKKFYLTLLAESEKTPLVSANEGAQQFSHRDSETEEDWDNDSLREDVSTSSENETSVVLLGDMGENHILLTGDAGIRALNNAICYAEQKQGIKLSQYVNIYQIPHHGGRHNVSPSVLDSLLGSIVPEDFEPRKSACVSAAEKSDHPLKMVTNAFIRRGVKVYQTKGQTIQCSVGMPDRDGFVPATDVPFSWTVEEWGN